MENTAMSSSKQCMFIYCISLFNYFLLLVYSCLFSPLQENGIEAQANTS